MKREVEQLQEEVELDNRFPKFMYKKVKGSDPYMIYRALPSELPHEMPKVSLPPDVTKNDPQRKGLQLNDDHINYYRGDYPLFFPYYGDELSLFDHPNLVDPITKEPLKEGMYVIGFDDGKQKTYITRSQIIHLWNYPHPAHAESERARYFAQKLKNPATSVPFNQHFAKFFKIIGMTDKQRLQGAVQGAKYLGQGFAQGAANLVQGTGTALRIAGWGTQKIGSIANTVGSVLNTRRAPVKSPVKAPAIVTSEKAPIVKPASDTSEVPPPIQTAVPPTQENKGWFSGWF